MKKEFNFIIILFVFSVIFLVCACSTKSEKEASHQASRQASQSEDDAAKKREEMEERIISSPMLITSDYFRETAATGKSLRLFGDSKKEKELEERVAFLEQRLMGLPERAKDTKGLPVLRRKAVLLSLLGDLGLDVLSLLPASLRRTDGIVPMDSGQLSKLLEEKGLTVSDLTSTPVRKEIASLAGIQAFILVYFPQELQAIGGKTSNLRIDVIHSTENILIGSYLARVSDFDSMAKRISDDVVRGTEWSARVIKTEENKVFINSGRLTGLQPGDKLYIYGRGKELIDPITKRSLGFAPGELKGEIVIDTLFGTDASDATILKGTGFEEGDIVKMAQLA